MVISELPYLICASRHARHAGDRTLTAGALKRQKPELTSLSRRSRHSRATFCCLKRRRGPLSAYATSAPRVEALFLRICCVLLRSSKDQGIAKRTFGPVSNRLSRAPAVRVSAKKQGSWIKRGGNGQEYVEGKMERGLCQGAMSHGNLAIGNPIPRCATKMPFGTQIFAGWEGF